MATIGMREATCARVYIVVYHYGTNFLNTVKLALYYILIFQNKYGYNFKFI